MRSRRPEIEPALRNAFSDAAQNERRVVLKAPSGTIKHGVSLRIQEWPVFSPIKVTRHEVAAVKVEVDRFGPRQPPGPLVQDHVTKEPLTRGLELQTITLQPKPTGPQG